MSQSTGETGFLNMDIWQFLYVKQQQQHLKSIVLFVNHFVCGTNLYALSRFFKLKRT